MRAPIKAVILSGGKPFDYYVDSVNGDDSYDGRSSATAFATLSALDGKITNGSKIGIAKGSHLRGKLEAVAGGVNGVKNNLTIDAYGSGARPIIDGSDIIAALAWSATGGTTNVYQAAVTLDAGYSDQFARVWEDDVRLVAVANTAACDAAAGSYYASANTGAITLYVHATDSSDPGASGKVYEYNQRGCCLRTEGSGWKISNIETRRQLGGGGSIALGGELHTITDVICRDGTKHNLIYGDGCTLTNVQAIDAYYGATSGTLFVFNQTSPGGKGVTHTNCSASLPNTKTITTLATGFYGHVNIGGTFGTVTYNGCTTVDCYYGFNGQDATLIYNDCTVTGSNYAVQVQALGSITPAVTVNRLTAAGQQILLTQTIGLGGTTITFNDCTIAAPLLGAQIFRVITPNTTLVFTDCAISTKYGHLITSADCTALTLIQNGNTFTTVYNYSAHINGNAATTVTYTGDYNTYVKSQINIFNTTTYATLADIRAALGQENHSTFSP